MKDRETLEIHIHNLTRAQAFAIEDLLATWQQGGTLGCSRWTAFYADGDGNFRPACIVNGHVARHQPYVPPGKFWTNGEPWRGEYRMDFDGIAIALRHEEEQRAARDAASEQMRGSGTMQDAVDPVAGRGEGGPRA